MLEQHGRTKLHALLPLAVKRIRNQWPDAKTFGALVKYLPEVNTEYERRQRIVSREKDVHLQEQTDQDRREQERSTQQQVINRVRPAWQTLSPAEREVIEQHIREKWPHIARIPSSFERYCLLEYAQQTKQSA
jgi:hypothetical protein